jgi:hypothetical protein
MHQDLLEEWSPIWEETYQASRAMSPRKDGA